MNGPLGAVVGFEGQFSGLGRRWEVPPEVNGGAWWPGTDARCGERPCSLVGEVGRCHGDGI